MLGMQNTLEGYATEGLAVSQVLVVVRFNNLAARQDSRKSSAELKTNESVLTNSKCL
jgi:hypothetical protein